MPSTSTAQHNAMEAAAHGKSTLGIPKKVGEEFSRADAADQATLAANAAIPAGLRKRQAFDSVEPRTLYVHRPLKNADALREWAKAQGFKATLPADDMHATIAFSKTPLDWNAVPDGFDSEIVPASPDQKDGARSVERLGDEGAVVLRFESTDLANRWRQFRRAGASWDYESYQPHVTITYDSGDVDLSKVVPYDGPLEFGEEAFDEIKAHELKEQALDSSMAMDRAATRATAVMASDSPIPIAMDRDSVREKTRDGRLIVKKTHVTKANVCPYRGEEIPGWEALGLDKDRVYNLLRDPEELRKAAPTLNGVQLLIKHTPVNAKDPHQDKTVGSFGTDAEFDGEYLDNSMFVNTQDAIDLIESGKQHELSAGYHYKPDMTPGNFGGKAYDGVMRDIVFNHVALVEDGRAGPDVVVGDAALKESDMAKATRFGAMTLSLVASSIAPLLAMDQKVTLSKDLFAPLTSKNFKDSREKLLGGVRSAIDGKLRTGIALDATMKDLAKVVDAFPDDIKAGIDEPAPEDKQSELDKMASVEPAKAIAEPGSTYDAEPLKGFLRDCGMDEEKIAKCMDMMPKNGMAGDEGETPEEKEAREKKEAKAATDKKTAKDEKDKDMVTKPAMDAALKAQADGFQKELAKVRDTERGVRVAIAEIKPWVGELPVTMAFDSATDVYRHVAGMLKIDGAKTLHADALLPIIKAQPKPGAKAPAYEGGEHMALDSSILSEAMKIAPGLENISTQL